MRVCMNFELRIINPEGDSQLTFEGAHELWIVNPGVGEDSQLTFEGARELRIVNLREKDSQLTFEGAHELWIVNPGGGGDSQLTNLRVHMNCELSIWWGRRFAIDIWGCTWIVNCLSWGDSQLTFEGAHELWMSIWGGVHNWHFRVHINCDLSILGVVRGFTIDIWGCVWIVNPGGRKSQFTFEGAHASWPEFTIVNPRGN